MVLLFLVVILISQVRGYPELEIPECSALSEYGETICTEQTHGWCDWNTKYEICETTSNVEAIFVDYYEAATNPFYMMLIPCIYCILFMISKQVANYLIYSKKYISKVYYEKIVIYVLEIFGVMPVIFQIIYPIFIYEPMFNPNKYIVVTPLTYRQLYGSVALISGATTSIYMFEMVYARQMRWQLKMHHWVVIVTGMY